MGTGASAGKKKNTVRIAVAAALLLLAAAIAMTTSREHRAVGSDQAWYYDLATGELFAAAPQGMPPIDAPVGGAGMGVIAHVYACGACSEANRQIVAIETLSEAARRVQAKLAADPRSVTPEEAAAALPTGRVVAAPPAPGAEPEWVVASTDAGYAVLDKATTLCDGQAAQLCTP